MNTEDARNSRKATLDAPSNLGSNATSDISAVLLADVFALYGKTKNFHWHISGPHFRDYHLLLHEQAQQILAERARAILLYLAERTGRFLGQPSDRGELLSGFFFPEQA
jgi:starvation-inducible DNA-binding protein